MIRTFTTLLGLAILFGLAAPAYAAPMERLFYYNGTDLGKQSLFTHANSIDIFAPQSYGVDAKGNVTGSVPKDILAFTKKNKIDVMPLVVNAGFGRQAGEDFLNSSKAQKKAIKALVKEAKKHGYVGYQLDFEQMYAKDRDKYTKFVKDFAAAMHKKKKLLSVAVIAQFSENEAEYLPGVWPNLAGVYDYKELGKHADFVSIMSYDDPTSRGPIASYAWLERVVKWSVSQIPPEKVSLGVATYYWQYDDATGKRVGIGGAEGINNVFNLHSPIYRYDAVQKAPVLTYTSSITGKKHTLWYENGQSVKDKIPLVTKNGLRGMSFWALGLEVPDVFQAIKQ